jgi:hypothetical protein
MSWKSKLSAIIVTSSTKADLISAAYCAAAVALHPKLAQELGFVEVSPLEEFFVKITTGLLHLVIRVILRGVPSIVIFDSCF